MARENPQDDSCVGVLLRMVAIVIMVIAAVVAVVAS